MRPAGSLYSVSAAARRFAWIAFVLGIGHAAFSVYWALGGTWLLDTVGGALEAQGRAGDPALRLVVWVAAILKVVAAVAGPLGISLAGRPRSLARFIGWAAAIILVLYGGVLTGAGLLVQLGMIARSPDADDRALAWHAFFWDPWFLLWGLCLGAALRHSRSGRATNLVAKSNHRPTTLARYPIDADLP